MILFIIINAAIVFFNVCLCVCLFNLRPLIFPSRGGKTRDLSSGCKIDQVDFTDWITFLSSILIENLNQESFRGNTSRLSSGISYLAMNGLYCIYSYHFYNSDFLFNSDIELYLLLLLAWVIFFYLTAVEYGIFDLIQNS